MSLEGLVAALIIGAVAGWLPGTVVRGSCFGLIGDIIVGILGPRGRMDLPECRTTSWWRLDWRHPVRKHRRHLHSHDGKTRQTGVSGSILEPSIGRKA